jgi:AcrR family transcriptional regulator
MAARKRSAKKRALARPADAPRSEPAASDGGRERLIGVAQKLFAERGFDGITIRDISAAAHVSVGLIHHHFGSKDGLRKAVDEACMAQFDEILKDHAALTDDASKRGLEAVSDWTEAWIDRHVANWSRSVHYMRRALLEGGDWGAQVFERFYAITRAAVDRLDAAGRLRPDVDRLWLPILFMYLDLGTLLLDPYIERVLGKSGFDRDLWRRRHRAYSDLIWRGTKPGG